MPSFGDRLLRGELLRPETVELLWTPMRTTDGTTTEEAVASLTGDRAARR